MSQCSSENIKSCVFIENDFSRTKYTANDFKICKIKIDKL